MTANTGSKPMSYERKELLRHLDAAADLLSADGHPSKANAVRQAVAHLSAQPSPDAAQFMFEAACSGLRYESPGACGEVAAIHIGGVRYAVSQPDAAQGVFPAWYGIDKPWPLHNVLLKLIDAAQILLDRKLYDGHGHEAIRCAQWRAEEIIKELGIRPVQMLAQIGVTLKAHQGAQFIGV